MNLREFQTINAKRGRKWHHGDLNRWTYLEWAGAMCGEAGEAANYAKKMRRLEQGLRQGGGRCDHLRFIVAVRTRGRRIRNHR